MNVSEKFDKVNENGIRGIGADRSNIRLNSANACSPVVHPISLDLGRVIKFQQVENSCVGITKRDSLDWPLGLFLGLEREGGETVVT